MVYKDSLKKISKIKNILRKIYKLFVYMTKKCKGKYHKVIEKNLFKINSFFIYDFKLISLF